MNGEGTSPAPVTLGLSPCCASVPGQAACSTPPALNSIPGPAGTCSPVLGSTGSCVSCAPFYPLFPCHPPPAQPNTHPMHPAGTLPHPGWPDLDACPVTSGCSVGSTGLHCNSK